MKFQRIANVQTPFCGMYSPKGDFETPPVVKTQSLDCVAPKKVFIPIKIEILMGQAGNFSGLRTIFYQKIISGTKNQNFQSLT
jgi:hypothetical protein